MVNFKIKREFVNGDPNHIKRFVLIQEGDNSIELSFEEVDIIVDKILEFQDEEYQDREYCIH